MQLSGPSSLGSQQVSHHTKVGLIIFATTEKGLVKRSSLQFSVLSADIGSDAVYRCGPHSISMLFEMSMPWAGLFVIVVTTTHCCMHLH